MKHECLTPPCAQKTQLDFFRGELTHYKSLCVRKFLKEFAKILVPLFVCRTENLRVEEKQHHVNPEG